MGCILQFSINHMTAPNLGWRDFIAMAQRGGANGVEFRNDLPTPLFDGDDAQVVAKTGQDHGMIIFAMSQVYPFNSYDSVIAKRVETLIAVAKCCGAGSISLIPRNDGTCQGNGERQANLRLALREIKPMLEQAGIVGLVEPLGFERSSLRTKAEAINAIEGIGGADVFKIVHDTFHHHLAQETEFFPQQTGMVHISGVVDPTLAINQMEDEHRVLVDDRDRLGNIDQLGTLVQMGYAGPISIESFSPQIHTAPDLETQVRDCLEFVKRALMVSAQ